MSIKTRRTAEKRPRNLWKAAFWTLIGLIIIGMGSLIIAIHMSSNVKVSSQTVKNEKNQTVSVSMNKAQLNRLSQYYLTKLQTQDNGRAKYHFEVANQGIVYGSIKLLGADVDYSMFFTPKVLSNGNIELHAIRMALGRFPVPISFVLFNVKKAYRLPHWVKLIPDKKTIVLDITHMSRHGLNYRARQISLQGQGKFAFDIILPKGPQGD